MLKLLGLQTVFDIKVTNNRERVLLVKTPVTTTQKAWILTSTRV